MSTKIYEAYRTKPGVKLFPLIEKIRNLVEKKAKDEINMRYRAWAKFSPVELQKMWAAVYPQHTKKENFNDFDFSALLRHYYSNQVSSSANSFWDLNLGFTIRQLGTKFYLLPLRGSFWSRDILKELKKLPELEDYCYWNNTDEPDGMDIKEWKKRGKTWNKLDKNWQKNYLYLDIVSLDTFFSICPSWDIYK